MAVTQNSYTQSGSTTEYAFTFPYLKTTDVKVQLDATVTTAFSLLNATTIKLDSAPTAGTVIKIYRETDTDSAPATFYAGSSVKSEDLNDNFTQNLYATQEINARYISNLAPVLTGNLTMAEDTSIVFEGATDDAHETTLAVADPTADRTITLPNVTGTVITTGDTDTVTATVLADNAVVNSKLASNAVTTAKITDGSVTTDKIAANAVTSSRIADSAVDTAQLTAAAVTGAKIANDQINSQHYVDLSIDREHLANDVIDSTKLNDGCINSEHFTTGCIDTAHIADNQVTADKLAHTSVTAGSYTAADITVDAQGRITAASAGIIQRSEIAGDAIDGTKLEDDAVNSEHVTDGAIDRVHLAADIVDGTKIADDSINSEHYVDGSIDHVHLANDIIDGDNIQDDVINSEHIAAGAVDLEHMSANSVDSDQYVDGSIDRVHLAADIIDATKIADDAVTTDHIQDAELVTLAGMQTGTASKLADSTALTSDIADLNQIDGMTKETSVTDDDAKFPTSGAVVDYVAAQIAPIGGLEVIANDASFPNTQPSAGVVISIADAGGLVVNGSGTSTTGRTANGTTVTINNINSQFNSTTIADGVAMMVSSTGSSQTYNYHKATLKEADLLSLSNDINDFAARYRVANTAPSSSLDEGDLWWDMSTDKLKVYDGSSWEEVASSGDFYINTISSYSGTGGNSATFNGSAYRFVLSNPGSTAQQHLVSINGVIQKPNSGTSQPSEGFVIDGSSIIFSNAPASGSDYFIYTLGSTVSIGTPSDNTVATAKLQNLAVTTAKIAADAVDGTKIADDAVGAEHIEDLDADVKFVDSAKIVLGTGNDCKIHFNGTNTVVDQYAGTFEIAVANASEYAAKFIPNGAVELYYNGLKKFETYSTGVEVSGNLWIQDGSSTDNRVTLGTGGDLSLYHDGTHSYIENGTGHLQIKVDEFRLLNNAGSENMIDASADDAVKLYYDSSKKFETTSSGAKITGALTFANTGQAISLHDDRKLHVGSGDDMEIFHDGTNTMIDNNTGELKISSGTLRLRADNGGCFNEAQTETAIDWAANGAVRLYYDNTKKFETASNGITVTTGHITLDSADYNVYLKDGGKVKFGNGEDLVLYHDSTNSNNKIEFDQDLKFRPSGSEDGLTIVVDGGVKGYYNDELRFETINTGFLATSDTTSHPGVLKVKCTAGASSQGYIGFEYGSGPTSGGGISRNGTSQTPEFYSGSDRRIKKDIVDLAGTLSKLNQIQLKSFKYKDDPDAAGIGPIAQDLISVFPDKVTKSDGDDGTGDTVPDGAEPWTVGTGFTWEIIKAIQELSAKVAALEAA